MTPLKILRSNIEDRVSQYSLCTSTTPSWLWTATDMFSLNCSRTFFPFHRWAQRREIKDPFRVKVREGHVLVTREYCDSRTQRRWLSCGKRIFLDSRRRCQAYISSFHRRSLDSRLHPPPGLDSRHVDRPPGRLFYKPRSFLQKAKEKRKETRRTVFFLFWSREYFVVEFCYFVTTAPSRRWKNQPRVEPPPSTPLRHVCSTSNCIPPPTQAHSSSPYEPTILLSETCTIFIHPVYRIRCAKKKETLSRLSQTR